MQSEVRIKTNMGADRVADFLQDLVNSFKEGTVCIEKGTEFVTLKPGKDIAVEIGAAYKKDKQKLHIELSWLQLEHGAETVSEFRISAQEPEVEAPLAEGAILISEEPEVKAMLSEETTNNAE